MTDISQLLFSVPTPVSEAVAALLAESCHGLEQRDAETTPSMAAGVTEFVVWVTASAVDRRVEEVKALLHDMSEAETVAETFTWHAEQVDPETWKDTYKKYFTTNRLGRHIVIQPSWEEYKPQPGDHVIALDPGMAFGTGLHASTQLVIHCLERLAYNGVLPKRVLDAGCGSGILSLAAAKIWPSARILAVDNDEHAVEICRENVAANQLQSRITVEHLEAQRAKGAYDVVLANLTAELLIDLQPKLSRLVGAGDVAVLSGITAEQAPFVARSYCRELQMEPMFTEELEGWRALLLRSRG